MCVQLTGASGSVPHVRSEEHTSELQSRSDLVCRLLLEKKKKKASEVVVLDIRGGTSPHVPQDRMSAALKSRYPGSLNAFCCLRRTHHCGAELVVPTSAP